MSAHPLSRCLQTNYVSYDENEYIIEITPHHILRHLHRLNPLHLQQSDAHSHIYLCSVSHRMNSLDWSNSKSNPNCMLIKSFGWVLSGTVCAMAYIYWIVYLSGSISKFLRQCSVSCQNKNIKVGIFQYIWYFRLWEWNKTIQYKSGKL